MFAAVLLSHVALAGAPLVAVATEHDVTVHDVYGAGVVSGDLGVGAVDDLDRTENGHYLYGIGAHTLPFRAPAGTGTVVGISAPTRVTTGRAIDVQAGGGKVWTADGDVLRADVHTDFRLQSGAVDPTTRTDWLDGVAMDARTGHVWSVHDAFPVTYLLRTDPLARTTDRPWKGPRTHELTTATFDHLEPHPDGGVVFTHYQTGYYLEWAAVEHVDGSGQVDTLRLGSTSPPVDLAVDPVHDVLWVGQADGTVTEVDLQSGLQAIRDLPFQDLEALAVGPHGDLWVAADQSLWHLPAGSQDLVEHAGAWTGDVVDMVVLEVPSDWSDSPLKPDHDLEGATVEDDGPEWGGLLD